MMKRMTGLFLIALLSLTAKAENDFRIKGFHLDQRIQVMQMPALRQFAKKLSEQGINTLLMEWEATYPYGKHAVIANQYAYTREEVKSFIRYCNQLGIDVIPLQQSFGHVEYILRHSRYKNLREDQKDYSQVNPIKEAECKALFTDLFADMASTHTSRYIHIGGDETYLLGRGEASKKKVAEVGKGRLYGDYVKMLCDVVVAMGKIPVMWADIALHYPEALKGLPAQTVFIDWNYGWNLNRFGDHEKLMQSGFEVWGSPAIRSSPDNYYLTEWGKHFNNVHTFLPQSRELGYKGMIMTSWSTSGIYTQIFESSAEMIDMHVIRRVYPISGFNMLIAAYLEGLKSAAALPVNDFVIQYSMSTYGFNKADAERFWHALRLPQKETANADIHQLLDSVRFTAQVLYSLKPTKGIREFSHYQLMTDIRLFYLQCMQIEQQMNAEDYTKAQAQALLKALNALQPAQLSKRFAELQKDLLYPSEIQLENTLRTARWATLQGKLGNSK